MTTIEAAERLGLAPATVRHQIDLGRIAARKVGRDWRVTAREVDRYRSETLGRPGPRRS
ncbi:MAG: helix-turn-helix domain-containing protein [Chloroflexi bacterium]|nr:helix-turn-helix domain-containing protein [Chloroflexota bacterium]